MTSFEHGFPPRIEFGQVFILTASQVPKIARQNGVHISRIPMNAGDIVKGPKATPKQPKHHAPLCDFLNLRRREVSWGLSCSPARCRKRRRLFLSIITWAVLLGSDFRCHCLCSCWIYHGSDFLKCGEKHAPSNRQYKKPPEPQRQFQQPQIYV